MSAATGPVRPPQPRRATVEDTLAWLDALADGRCTPEAFLDAMGGKTLGDREENWEVLSLLDQYYRRGKLDPEVFHSLRSHFEDAALSRGNDPASHTAPAAEPHPGLQREFQHLQLLSHPNIVRVHEFDRDGDVAFFTMELLSGALLSHVLQTRNAVPLPRPYAWAVIRDVGAALAHAHSRGVIHGDINPQNIFITHDGELRVLDFSASHSLLADRRTGESALLLRSPVATPGYASCQLLEGRPPDARDDLF